MYVVMQMPKTGTNTLLKTLSSIADPDDVYRVHYLDSKFFDRVLKQFVQINVPVDYNIFYYFIQHMAVRGQILKRLRDGCDEHVYVTAAIREPVSMLVASYFQLLDNFNEYASQDIWKRMPFEKLLSIFKSFIGVNNDIKPGYSRELGITENGGYSQNLDWTYYIKMQDIRADFSNWFDDNLKKYFDYDIFKYDFNLSQGYTIVNNGCNHILIYKFEQCIHNLEIILSEFLSYDKIGMLNENMSQQKSYSKIYKKFSTTLKLPKSFLKDIYDNKEVKYFYTEEEIETFIERWKE